MSSLEHYWLKMTHDDQQFFKQLGQRVTTFRKAQGMTQTHLADTLGISQQHMASFEKGIRKIPASMLPTLAQVFAITVDELVGRELGASKGKRGPMPKLQQQLEQISHLPRGKQQFVIQMIDTVLHQTS